MRIPIGRATLLALSLSLGACAESGPVAPLAAVAPLLSTTAAIPSVRFAELHYDNSGTDTGEAIEISGPAGTDLTGWQIVLYNGNGGAVYNTRTLSGTIVASCGTRGVVVESYPSNGIQNGNPDGLALVDNGGTVIEFLSYGGTFTAVGGPADGTLPVDIGVTEGSATPVGHSLQRASDGTWAAPAPNTFGSCNDAGTVPPPEPVVSVGITPTGGSIAVGATVQFTATARDASGAPVPGTAIAWSSSDVAVVTVSNTGLASGVAEGAADIVATSPNGVSGTVTVTVTAPPPPGLPATRFSELHYDNVGIDQGEAIEVEGPAGTDLTGWSIVLYNGSGGAPYNTTALTGTIPDLCTGRGVVVVNYPSNGIQNGNPDGLALVGASGAVVEFLSYGGTFTAVGGPANGRLSVDIGVMETGAPIGQSLSRDAAGVWQSPATSSFGACNGGGSGPPPGGSISFSGRTSGDPALPIGFEDQLFATVRDGSGVVVPTMVSWTSETPTIASVDANGVVRALSVGTFVIRATAPDGTTATYALDTQVATPGGTASYGNNVEFGTPFDGDPSDDVLLARAEYTASWNPTRGTPNWVSYNLEATHIGSQDRCDCFTFDPALPSSIARYTTADYTGAGAFAGYGIDRGHLARSFDRSTGLLDNANTFYFSNIIPQAADNNQGPWAALENDLGNQARFQNKEVFVIAGVAGHKGTVKGEGKIVIPAYTWKVAVVLPRDLGLGSINDIGDLTVLAVVMPNEPGIRNVPWQTFEVTVDSVEALSGYNLLDLLPDPIEIAVESGTSPPSAVIDGPYTSTEGAAVAMSAAGSSDPDGDALTYTWAFGDGTFGNGETTSHVYAQDGTYTVELVVSDPRGLSATVTTTATVTNVAPIVAPLVGAILLVGETYQETGSFADPGSDAWTALVDYGDGSGVQPLALTGQSFALSHTFIVAGSYTVSVVVADDDDSGAATATVTVLNSQQGIEAVIADLDQRHAAGSIPFAVYTPLRARLGGALASARAGQFQATLQQLANVQASIDRYEADGRLTPADAAAVRAFVNRVIAAMSHA